MSTSKNIVLLGAYGFTGLRIARLLNVQKIGFSIAGRDREQLEQLKDTNASIRSIITTDINSGEELDDLISKTDILISCIGPYNISGSRIIERVIRAGIVYLDISGEQHFINESFRKRNEAVKSGACLVHSLSFESALTDLLAAVKISNKEKWNELSSFYYFENTIPSSGTRLTMQISKFFPTYSIRNGKLFKTDILSFTDDVWNPERQKTNKAIFMPYPEVLFFHQRYRPQHSASYLLTDEFNASYLQSGNNAGPDLDTILERENRKKKRQPDEEACRKQYFEIFLYSKKEEAAEKTWKLSGYNMYKITAGILVQFLKEMLEQDLFYPGVHAPGELAANPAILLDNIMEENNIQLTENVAFSLSRSYPNDKENS